MSHITAALAMSHAPGMTGWPETLAASERRRMDAACAQMAEYLEANKPDVIVAFLDDHFEQIFRSLAPTFAIGVADNHSGPPEYLREVLGINGEKIIPGRPDLAEHILQYSVHAGFDMARMGAVEYGNNLMVALELIRPAYDIPVVPIFVNVYSPPLPTMDRAYQLGDVVRRAIENFGDRNLKGGAVATGGPSHWPPIWLPHIHGWDEATMHPHLRNMKRFQTEGRRVLEEIPHLMMDMGAYEQQMPRLSNQPLTNPVWDTAFLDLMAAGDVDAIRTMSYDEIERGGGFGGHEVLNWSALLGAVNGKAGRLIDYSSVPEWITGIGYMVYDF